MTSKITLKARKAGGITAARGTLLAGCALALCGMGVIARTMIFAPDPAPEETRSQMIAVPVAVERKPARERQTALVVVPPAPQPEPEPQVEVARDVAGDAVDPLAINLAQLAARIAREQRALDARQADKARREAALNAIDVVPAAPRPAAPLPGPRLAQPARLATLGAPDAAPGTMPVAPVPDFLADPPMSSTALAEMSAPLVPPAEADATETPAETALADLPDRARTAPPVRPEQDIATAEPVAEAPPPAALAASLVPLPRPANLVTRRAAAPAPDVEKAPETVLAAAPAPAPTRKTAAPAVSEPELGRRVARSDVCRKALSRNMPNRRSRSPEGTEFFAGLGNLSGPQRDARIVAELANGNMPDFLHNLQPVRLTGTDATGQPAEIVICVTPDYLALGSDRDHVRVPMGLPAARQIAARFGMSLPTPKMVDAIWAQSDVRLPPAPMQAGPQMSSTDYFLRHNATIEGQLGRAGGLVSGHKKDVVIASRMQNNPGRVAIYGWHRRNGNPIQPVSTVHGATYADYSHGIRLVANTAYVNGRAADLDELLTTRRYARILNPDGPLPAPVIKVASR